MEKVRGPVPSSPMPMKLRSCWTLKTALATRFVYWHQVDPNWPPGPYGLSCRRLETRPQPGLPRLSRHIGRKAIILRGGSKDCRVRAGGEKANPRSLPHLGWTRFFEKAVTGFCYNRVVGPDGRDPRSRPEMGGASPATDACGRIKRRSGR